MELGTVTLKRRLGESQQLPSGTLSLPIELGQISQSQLPRVGWTTHSKSPV